MRKLFLTLALTASVGMAVSGSVGCDDSTGTTAGTTSGTTTGTTAGTTTGTTSGTTTGTTAGTTTGTTSGTTTGTTAGTTTGTTTGTTSGATDPTTAPNFQPMFAVSTGSKGVTCVIKEADRGLYCMGTLDQGSLGIGLERPDLTVISENSSPKKILIRSDFDFNHSARLLKVASNNDGTPDTARWKAISVNSGALSGANCAIREDGTLWCWGENESCGVGNWCKLNPTDKRCIAHDNNSPQQPLPGNPVFNACHPTEDQNGMALNGYEFGDPTKLKTTGLDAYYPQKVSNDTDWQMVDTSIGGSVCAIRSGMLFCWGANGSNQLGFDNGGLKQDTPIQVGSNNDWVDVSLGVTNGCGIRQQGSDKVLYCWGADREYPSGNGIPAPVGSGILGIGDNPETDPVYMSKMLIVMGIPRLTLEPVPVKTDIKDWKQVSVGNKAACAIRANGDLYCWGYNNSGPVGVGTTGNIIVDQNSLYNVPTKVKAEVSDGWSLVVVSDDTDDITNATTAYGIRNQALYTWGKPDSGSFFGNNSSIDFQSEGFQYSPKQASNPNVLSFQQPFKTISGNDAPYFCAIKASSGEMICMGTSQNVGALGSATLGECFQPNFGSTLTPVCPK